MGEKTMNRLVTSAMNIARQVGLVLAPHTMLFYKGVITIDSVILRVNPEFDYKRETRRAMRLIRMRELDKLYTPGNVIDTALLTQLLLTYLPDFAASRLQDFEQGQRLIYRKLNLLPVILGNMFSLLSVGLGLAGVGVAAQRFGHLEWLWKMPGVSLLHQALDLGRHYVWLFFLAAIVCAWAGAALKARSFVKVQKEE
jgi:hypothetical protein